MWRSLLNCKFTCEPLNASNETQNELDFIYNSSSASEQQFFSNGSQDSYALCVIVCKALWVWLYFSFIISNCPPESMKILLLTSFIWDMGFTFRSRPAEWDASAEM